jgi:hypothetical protein
MFGFLIGLLDILKNFVLIVSFTLSWNINSFCKKSIIPFSLGHLFELCKLFIEKESIERIDLFEVLMSMLIFLFDTNKSIFLLLSLQSFFPYFSHGCSNLTIFPLCKLLISGSTQDEPLAFSSIKCKITIKYLKVKSKHKNCLYNTMLCLINSR